jgi:hypothetical protein
VADLGGPLARRLAELLDAAGAETIAGDHPGLLYVVPPDGAEDGAWDLLAVADDDAGAVQLLAVCPLLAPPERRAAVAEAIARASFGMLDGSFELDPADGEVRFRIGLLLGGTELSRELLVAMASQLGGAVDTYAAALEAVVAGEADPAEAIAAAERAPG